MNNLAVEREHRMMMRAGATLALIIACSAQGLLSQTVDGDHCVGSARAILTRDSRVNDGIRGMIGSCPELGGSTIAAVWRRVGNDARELNELWWWSRSLQDQRILDAVSEVARDTARPDAVRFGALRVLLTYIEPSATIPQDRLENPSSEYATLSNSTHANPLAGRHAVTPNAGAQIAELLQFLTTSDPSQPIRAAARYIWEAVASQYPDRVPLPAGAVTITNVCADRVRVENSTAINLSLMIVTTTGNERYWRVRPNASVEGNVGFGGVARIVRAGTVLGEAGPSNQPCPRT